MRESNLLIPGPTPLPPRVLAAMAQQMTNHRSPAFGQVMSETLDGLRGIFQTRNDIIPLVCSGTGGLEAAVTNFLSPGEAVLSINNGHFSERFAEIAERFGVRVDRVVAEWGRPVPLGAIAERLRPTAGRDYRAVLVTQSETSTGVHNDVAAIRSVLGDHPALLMVDAVSSLGAIPLQTDAWQVDVVTTGSQKALMSPPGMAFVSVSERAWAAAERASIPRFYLDLRRGRDAVHRAVPSTPFTTAISVAYGVQEAVRLIHEEGLERVFERHRRMARMVRAGVRGMGLDTLPEDAYAVDTVTAVRMPEDVDSVAVVRHAREHHGVQFGGGIGRLEHAVIRIGHLGYTQQDLLLAGLATLGRTLQELGHPVATDAGLAAARRTLEPARDGHLTPDVARKRAAG
jgi:aspartate aminotransferase-like enzyme